MSRRVVIIQAFVKQYRAPLFSRLYELLREDGIELIVLYSDPPTFEARKGDNVDLPAPIGRKVRGHWFAGNKVLIQDAAAYLKEADLVIAEQANKHLVNHVLMLLSVLRLKKFALWGLGENLQDDRRQISECLKRLYARHANWFFAYTKGTAAAMAHHGVPRERTTVLQNSVDTNQIRYTIASFSPEAVLAERRRLGIPDSAPIGLFCGMLDPVKGLAMLLDSAMLIRKKIPDFELLIAGAGPDALLAIQAAEERNWVHYLGPIFGDQKALTFRMADSLLMPGRCGLAILDAFAAGLPLVAASLPHHGPEMEYLEHEKNGLLLQNSVEAYSEGVVQLFRNPKMLAALKAGATASASKYSVEAMAENFRRGIVQCLSGTTQK